MKARKINLQRFNGTLNKKPYRCAIDTVYLILTVTVHIYTYRNPILNEKTPRDPAFGDWDFSTIPAKPGRDSSPTYCVPLAYTATIVNTHLVFFHRV